VAAGHAGAPLIANSGRGFRQDHHWRPVGWGQMFGLFSSEHEGAGRFLSPQVLRYAPALAGAGNTPLAEGVTGRNSPVRGMFCPHEGPMHRPGTGKALARNSEGGAGFDGKEVL
jgi:hypothetical protein